MYSQADQEISAYAYERTLRLTERIKLLNDLKLGNKDMQLQVSHLKIFHFQLYTNKYSYFFSQSDLKEERAR